MAPTDAERLKFAMCIIYWGFDTEPDMGEVARWWDIDKDTAVEWFTAMRDEYDADEEEWRTGVTRPVKEKGKGATARKSNFLFLFLSTLLIRTSRGCFEFRF